MTELEALKEIISKPKWYVPDMESVGKSTHRVTALRIMNGTAGLEARKRFFEAFGYKYETNVVKNEKP